MQIVMFWLLQCKSVPWCVHTESPNPVFAYPDCIRIDIKESWQHKSTWDRIFANQIKTNVWNVIQIRVSTDASQYRHFTLSYWITQCLLRDRSHIRKQIWFACSLNVAQGSHVALMEWLPVESVTNNKGSYIFREKFYLAKNKIPA